ncbi:MAG TPA: hypothetical protein VM222_03445, partial [Planctomycetota bacterium]|nr:hypothetical protein [Planctomycetota bacterium]
STRRGMSMSLLSIALFLLVSVQEPAKSGIQVSDGGESLKPGEIPAAFKGDAVLSNGRLSLVVPKGGAGAEIRVGGSTRAVLHLSGVATLDRVAVAEYGKGSATLVIGNKLVSATLKLKKGDVTVEVQSAEGVEKLRVDCPSRFVVLPDFFADDIVIDARKLPPASVEIPSENFILQLAGKGEAIVMSTFENKEQDVRLTLDGAGDDRRVAGSEIEFGKGRKIWVSVLEAPQIWHVREIQAADAGKTLPLDWKMPFPAAWRCDLTRANDLADSWEMLVQKDRDGDYMKPSWMGGGPERLPATRKRWTTVLGSFLYPVWSDAERNGFIQPLKHDKLAFRGPAVIYPVNRVNETPLEVFTVIDLVRNTLGAGPCEYLLDLEGNRSESKGRATCSSRDVLTGIYKAGEQKAKRAEVEKVLQDDLLFVKHIRGRITRYVEAAARIREYLAGQKKAHPELAGPIDELDKIAAEVDERFEARREKMKTPDHVAKMNDDFRRDVMDYEGPDALDRCKKYATALVEVGDNQDELSGECRWVIKAVRQKAGLLMAADPRMAPIAAELRARTQETLKNPAGHEGNRH